MLKELFVECRQYEIKVSLRRHFVVLQKVNCKGDAYEIGIAKSFYVNEL